MIGYDYQYNQNKQSHTYQTTVIVQLEQLILVNGVNINVKKIRPIICLARS